MTQAQIRTSMPPVDEDTIIEWVRTDGSHVECQVISQSCGWLWVQLMNAKDPTTFDYPMPITVKWTDFTWKYPDKVEFVKKAKQHLKTREKMGADKDTAMLEIMYECIENNLNEINNKGETK